MYLKALTLQGFKSFVQRTQLVFHPGITAIVGPNGSGKSNVADAVRWVLGEQSLRSLRGRRTEDILFAGGPGRPPAGLAEVTLVFDNSQQWLDVPFSEVAIARRAYRSGETEYYLNRDRVRLRDIADVLGRIGLSPDGFAIVGQGTVDAALSLRPEDRRTLIEQAAAIEHLHARLDDTGARLTQTQQNLDRVADLIAELAPRVKLLERQARQAREREQLQSELARGLVRWYAHLWSGPHRRRQQAIAEIGLVRDAAEDAQRQLATIDRHLQTAHATRQIVEQEVTSCARQLAAEQNARSAVEQARVRDQDRAQELARRLAEYESLLEQQDDDLERERGTLARLGEERACLERELAQVTTELEHDEAGAEGWRQRRATLERAAATAHQDQTRAEAQHAATIARHRAMTERLTQLRQAIADERERLDSLERQLAEARRQVDEARRGEGAARQRQAEALAARERLAQQLERGQTEVARQATHLATIEREAQSLRARFEALRQVEDAGTGYFSGVRAILQAANGHGRMHLDGIVGVVAKLIEVPGDTELAIETALGSHLQDIVVNRWADAEAAIAHLKKSGAGRATFLPLDTLRPPRRALPPRAPGIVGVASTLVTVAPALQVVAEFLLGQTLVVENLTVARRVLGECPPFWQIVTLEGEITRPSGVVTGGAPGQTRGALARHRELRMIQRALEERDAERARAAARLASARAELERIAAEVEAATATLRVADERHRNAEGSVGEAQRLFERLAQTLAFRREEIERSVAEQSAVERSLDEVGRAMLASEQRRQDATRQATEIDRQMRALEVEAAASIQALSAARSRRDRLRVQLQAIEMAAAESRTRLAAIEQHRRERADRLAEVRAAVATMQDQIAQRQDEVNRLDQRIAELARHLEERRQQLEQRRAEEQHWEAERQRYQALLQDARAGLAQAHQDHERAEIELDGIRQQIRLELGEIDETALARGELQIQLSAGALLSHPIEPVANPEQLRSRLDTLRSRLRAIAVSSEVVAEYDAARQRLSTMTNQAADLQQTLITLRATIDETRKTMKQQFDATFQRVAETFTRRFADIFGGGAARLIIDGDGESPGIEVIAQPPGKRAESLAMLSGGERALTAACLLFALIETNPPPFCVLDEVDAALDETNVGRFCGVLQELAARTQFIVITHNRRTMEAASTIYGLSLENRCESRVLSLQLPPSP